MKRQHPILWVLVCLLLQATTLTPAQKYPPPFPREGAKKILENQRVVLWEVIWPKDKPSPMHEHLMDQLSVTLEGGQVKITRPDGTSSVGGMSTVGSVTLTRKGTIHQEEGVLDKPQRKIMIELKDTSVPPLNVKPSAPIAFPRGGATKIFENDRAVAWDYTYEAKIARHFHDKDSVIVPLSNGELRSINADGTTSLIRVDFGVPLLGQRGRVHSEEVVSGQPRVIVVELK